MQKEGFTLSIAKKLDKGTENITRGSEIVCNKRFTQEKWKEIAKFIERLLAGWEGRDGDKPYLDKIMGIYRENKTNEY